jgi:hypothetical protein
MSEDVIREINEGSEWSQGNLFNTQVVYDTVELWQPTYWGNYINEDPDLVGTSGGKYAPSSQTVSFRPFEDMVAVEPSTNNVIPDGDFSNGSLTLPFTGAVRGDISIATGGLFGTYCLQHNSTDDDSYTTPWDDSSDAVIADASEGEIWTLSVYVKGVNGNESTQIWIFALDSNYTWIENTNVTKTPATDWSTCITATLTMPANTAYIGVRLDNNNTGDTVFWDGVQVEQKPYATSFTPDQRIGGALEYDLMPPSGTDATIFQKVVPNIAWDDTSTENGTFLQPTSEYILLWSSMPGTNGFMLRVERSNQVIDLGGWNNGNWNNTEFSYPYTGYTKVTLAIRIQGNDVNLWVDGNYVGEITITRPTNNTPIALEWDDLYGYIGRHDEFVIDHRALTSTEISNLSTQSLQLQRASSGEFKDPPLIDLSDAVVVDSTEIIIDGAPNGQSIYVDTNVSLDGGSTWEGWKTGHDGYIHDLPEGTSVTNGLLDYRFILSTDDTSVTPGVFGLTFKIFSKDDTPPQDSANIFFMFPF